MTAVLTLTAKEHGRPRIAVQVLFYHSVTNAEFGTGTPRVPGGHRAGQV